MSDIAELQITSLVEQYRNVPGGLLPLLQAIQRQVGYIPADSVAGIAVSLNRSAAEVHGVISFYHDLRTAERGRHTLQICCAESCQASGGRALQQQARDALGIDFGDTTADGSVTLEAVYCLGNCACSPSVRIDDDTQARVDGAALDALIARLRSAGDAT